MADRSRLQEIEGRFIGERYRKGDFLIGSITVCNGSVAVAEKAGIWGDRLTIKGDASPDELQHRQTYRFYGRWTTYGEEKQFTFTTFVPAVAHDREGIVAYLDAAGRGCGMGPGTARKAWDQWGSDAVRVIRENPRELLALNKRLTDEQLETIGARLQAQAKTENAQIEVTNLLSGRGFPKTLYRKTIKAWGNLAAQRIKENPYLLMRFRGVGFKLCDAIYLELGLDPAAMIRQALCAWYALASNTDGHIWFPIEYARQAVRKAIGSLAKPDEAIEHALELGRRSPDAYGAMAMIRTNGAGLITPDGTKVWVAEGKKAATEARLADLIVAAMNETRPRQITQWAEREVTETVILDHARCHRCSRQLTAPEVHIWNGRPYGPTCITTISDGEGVEAVSLHEWLQRNPSVLKTIQELPKGVIDLPEFSLWPDVDEIELINTHQREELSKALCGRIGLFSGSAGTGKTHCVARLVEALLLSGRIGVADIAIGAPTGKAAVRLNEVLHAAGVPVRAKTWHSLLAVGKTDDEEGWGFRYNESNPWHYKVIIGDETSMQDTSLMCAMFAARPKGCHVLLVGDINQLSPIGYGAPLRDLIRAGLPYGELTEIRRAEGGIAQTCKLIRERKPWGSLDNMQIIPSTNPEQQLDAVVATLLEIGVHSDPVWKSQVIVAVNANSPLSRKIVNERLQDELNHNQVIQNSIFRLDDKVVCTSNGWYRLVEGFDISGLDAAMVSVNEDGTFEAYVANGEIGRVLTIEDKKLTISLSAPSREIVVYRGQPSEIQSSDDDDRPTTGCNFELGYAISCHRMQGSESDNVIVLIDEYAGARMVCSREWVYTAISRARAHCFVIGQKSTADAMCARTAITKRKTFLAESILLAGANALIRSIA